MEDVQGEHVFNGESQSEVKYHSQGRRKMSSEGRLR